MQRATALLLVFLLLAGGALLSVDAQEKPQPPSSPWPQDVKAGGATITVYQPQPETFQGNKITGRAAVSVIPPGETEPKFGAIWLEARVSSDRESGVVELLELKIPRVRFPNASEEHQKKLIALLEREMPKWVPTIDIDRLATSLDSAEVQKREAKNLKTDPPKIVFVTEPTELVILQGKAALRPVENSTCMRVINTNFFLVLDAGSKQYFLNLGKVWMTAPDVMKGPWTHAKQVPAEVMKIAPKQDPEAAKEDEGLVPKIMVVNGAVELITTDGKPNYTPIAGGELLYVANTEASLLLEISSQQHYILVSGRWYRSKSLDGPWGYVAPGSLPKSFAKIPADSDMRDVRASVPGTDEAKDAVMDAQIPQTAAVKRVKPELKVTYDGDPVFVIIEGTKLSYGKNTAFTVIQDQSGKTPRFYCCHEAVWYEGPGPAGPWTVAARIPDSIYAIPASNPHYNVTYVRIYGYTPEVVYVGYLPGYYGGYVYGGTVVYGTGYIYPVWVGVVYYPRPVTYGWGFRYSPLGRWFSPWGVGGVVRRTRRRHYRRHHYSYNRHGGGHHRPYHRNPHSNRHRNNVNRNHARARTNQANRNRTGGRKNNVYANKKGNVSRRNSNGSYQTKKKNGWSKSAKGTSSQNRSASNRQRGNSRSSSRSRSRSSGSRGGGGRGGGSRGGGGGRR